MLSCGNGRVDMSAMAMFVEMQVKNIFSSCLYSARSLTCVREQRFIRIINYYYHHLYRYCY